MIQTSENTRCPLCGGQKKPGKTTFSADLGSSVVVLRGVQASICDQCGEEWISDKTAERIEEIVNGARDRNTQVEVMSM
ncbi:MAG: type II toxin-antitoxin system MqsA family antitoxin [Planctomycetes bacterium]|nr:type II toxin-antitoxin system MqsA family antitoxin [Planctomycetota bacterium]